MHCFNEKFTEFAGRLIFEIHKDCIALVTNVLVEPKVGHIEAVTLLNISRLDVLTHMVEKWVLCRINVKETDVFGYLLWI